MINVAATFNAHGGNSVLLAGLGQLRGAIGCHCGHVVFVQGLEAHAVRHGDASGCSNKSCTYANAVPQAKAG